jgi:hypothetical protein
MPTSKIVSLIGKTEVVEANFRGMPINFFRRTQRINVLDIEKATGKRYRDWLRNRVAREYIEAWQEMSINRYKEATITIKSGTKDDGTVSRKGSAQISANPQLGGIESPGVWADPAIALAFAQWCDARLHLWCNLQILHLLQHGEVNLDYMEWTAEQHQLGSDRNIEDKESTYTRW